jgi:hypothetical protein
MKSNLRDFNLQFCPNPWRRKRTATGLAVRHAQGARRRALGNVRAAPVHDLWTHLRGGRTGFSGMQNFTVLVHDDRYRAPMLRLVQAEDAKHARQLAQQIFAETAHHRGVEVWGGEERVFGIGPAARDRPI